MLVCVKYTAFEYPSSELNAMLELAYLLASTLSPFLAKISAHLSFNIKYKSFFAYKLRQAHVPRKQSC